MYSSSRYLQMADSGVYLTSLAVTVLISAIAIIVILLFTLVIILAILLASCQSKPDDVVKDGMGLEMGVDVCRSIILNFELNNMQENSVFPSMCKEYVFQYMTKGQYVSDVNGAIEEADNYIISTIANGDGSDRIMLNIDETTLSNVPYFCTFQNCSMLHKVDAWNRRVEEAKSPLLVPTLKLYQKFQNHGVVLIFLSRRHENQRDSTVENLLHAGYSGWTMLIMQTKDEVQMNAHLLRVVNSTSHLKPIIWNTKHLKKGEIPNLEYGIRSPKGLYRLSLRLYDSSKNRCMETIIICMQ